jgi:signal transduction histidine kinase
MFAHRSRTRQLLSIVTLSVLLSAGWFFVTLYYLDTFRRASQIRFKANRVRIELLEARRREKDFLLRSLSSPEFYRTGSTSYLELYRDTMISLRREIGELSAMLPSEHTDDVERLQVLVADYDERFEFLVAAYRRRGFEEYGIEGNLRSSARTLQQELEKTGNIALQHDFLELRQDESELLRFGDASRLQAKLAPLRTRILKLVPDSSALLAQLDQYESAVEAYRSIEEEIGRTEDTGLTGRYRDAAHAIDPIAEAVLIEQQSAQYIAGERLTAGLLLAFGLLVALLTATFSLTASARARSGELAQANEDLRAASAELTRSNAELQQFAYVASHDLQEPLRAVAGCVQLLQERCRGQLDAMGDQLIGHVVDGATRMQNLIDDLLTLSRVGTGGRPFTATDLNVVLNDVRANLQVSIQQSGASIVSVPMPTITADPVQMTQLFQNLIGNGIKFRGEQPPVIQVSAERKNEAWQFAIRDNGIGIEAQYFERIFLLFQRLHTRREYPGTGIGLTICKKIVERHGGRIWLQSVPKEGSTFFFTIPDRVLS